MRSSGRWTRRVLLLAVPILITQVPAFAGDKPSESSPTLNCTARPAEFKGVSVQKDQWITMSDGVRLSAEIHRPADANGDPVGGRYPVLMAVSPYNKNTMPAADDDLVRHGYVDVVVDVRGTGSSEGVYTSTYSGPEQRDGAELVEWAADTVHREWSDGSVGLHGGSYFGINQLLTAAQNPEGLKAIFPVISTGDAYRSLAPGGYMTSLFLFSVLVFPGLGMTPPAYASNDP